MGEMLEKLGGMLFRAAAYTIAVVSMLYENATKDGHLAAFGRQGIDELGTALKAFPESIQMQEIGGLFEPTQGEIAADRKGSVFGHGHAFRSPSQIAESRSAGFGRDEEMGPLRSPSEIAADRSGRDTGFENDRGHEMGRD